MEKDRFYYADDDHRPEDEFWFHQQQRLKRITELRYDLQTQLESVDPTHEDYPDTLTTLNLINYAFRSVYSSFCNKGMQLDADLVVHDVLVAKLQDVDTDQDS